MKTKKIILIFSLCFLLLACQSQNQSIEEKQNSDNDKHFIVEQEPIEEENIKEKHSLLTEEDYKLLDKSFSDLTTTEKQRLEEIKNSKELLSSDELKRVKTSIEKLEREKIEFTPEQSISYDLDSKNGKIYRFSPGIYGMENNLEIPEAGSFTFVFEGKGNFTITDPYGKEYYSTIIDSDNSVPKFRGFLFDGWEFETDGDLLTKMQLSQDNLGYTEHQLYRGVWNVGQDIGAGQYFITTLKTDIIPNDEFIVTHQEYNGQTDEYVIVNEYNSSMEKEAIQLEIGDVLVIKGINKILLETAD